MAVFMHIYQTQCSDHKSAERKAEKGRIAIDIPPLPPNLVTALVAIAEELCLYFQEEGLR